MKNIVIKVGGSLLYNDDLRLNELFLFKLKKWYDTNKSKISKLVIVTGGGKLSRNLGGNIKGLVLGDNAHGVAMQITQVNAEVVKGYLNDNEIYVPQQLSEALEFIQRDITGVMISGGLKQGWSTDMDAAVFADALKIETVYKLSNVDYVYDSDPRINKEAKKIEEITWKEYFKLFNISESSVHQPNVSSPVSVEASIFSQKKNLTFFISGGKNIYEKEDLSLVFESGTRITN